MLTFYSEILETISRRYELNKPTAKDGEYESRKDAKVRRVRSIHL
jgi:hypothetical protein